MLFSPLLGLPARHLLQNRLGQVVIPDQEQVLQGSRSRSRSGFGGSGLGCREWLTRLGPSSGAVGDSRDEQGLWLSVEEEREGHVGESGVGESCWVRVGVGVGR